MDKDIFAGVNLDRLTALAGMSNQRSLSIRALIAFLRLVPVARQMAEALQNYEFLEQGMDASCRREVREDGIKALAAFDQLEKGHDQ